MTRGLPRAFARCPATKFVVSANSSFETGPPVPRSGGSPRQFRCWKKIHEVGKNRPRGCVLRPLVHSPAGTDRFQCEHIPLAKYLPSRNAPGESRRLETASCRVLGIK